MAIHIFNGINHGSIKRSAFFSIILTTRSSPGFLLLYLVNILDKSSFKTFFPSYNFNDKNLLQIDKK